MTKDKQDFFNILQDVFCGKVKDIEGQSATVKLMRMKNKYYQHIEKHIEEEINQIVKEYPDFEKELYDKLYNFFHKYFTESGILTFASTPFHNSAYEKIYTNEDDVVLFWKTRDLYYIKTEKVFRSMNFDYKDYKIVFDASKVEGKRGNEKRSVIFSLKQAEGNKIVFEVQYKEGKKDTDYKEILKELKKKGISLTKEDLDEMFTLYNRQTDIDFFLHKRPREFLKEQFNLWLYQYLSEDHEWDLKRINQFNLLRRVAFKIIDFIAQFEEELVKIWLKPRLVFNSNYVITLDRIANKENGIEVIKKIVKHQNIQEQLNEWIDLNIVNENFKPEEILQEDSLNEKHKFLPIDTKRFKDIEIDILSLFDNIDDALDGWLIKSENFQALNTILPKFREKVQTIYIDPPFIVNNSSQFLYITNYKNATWLTMLANRLDLAKYFLKNEGSIFVNSDDTCGYYIRLLLDNTFGRENFVNEVVWAYEKPGAGDKKLKNNHNTMYFYSKTEKYKFYTLYVPRKGEKNLTRRINRYITNYDGKISPDWWNDFWDDIPSFATSMTAKERTSKMIGENFSTQLPEKLLFRIIKMTTDDGDIVMDFFLGSGTTIAVAHKLKRKWIGIETGQHFYSIVLPRMKKVLMYDSSGISKEEDVKEKYNKDNAGGFFIYYELEQFEDILNKCIYTNSFCEEYPDKMSNIFEFDLKLLPYIKINEYGRINLEAQTMNIDLIRSVSNVLGISVKKINSMDNAIFHNNMIIDIKNLELSYLKSLLFW
ncbi:MAG: site-specific DNA-methyltransferase [Conexivisphaerales archaeon]